jgi:hypothetical protein
MMSAFTSALENPATRMVLLLAFAAHATMLARKRPPAPVIQAALSKKPSRTAATMRPPPSMRAAAMSVVLSALARTGNALPAACVGREAGRRGALRAAARSGALLQELWSPQPLACSGRRCCFPKEAVSGLKPQPPRLAPLNPSDVLAPCTTCGRPLTCQGQPTKAGKRAPRKVLPHNPCGNCAVVA